MKDVECFETRFLRVSYYSGRTLTDPVLLSLLSLKGNKNYNLVKIPCGQYVLMNKIAMEKKILGHPCVNVRKLFQKLNKIPNFNLWEFCNANNILHDSIDRYPLRFQNPRVTYHVLSLTNAIALTMRMHKISEITVPQRFDRKSFIKSNQNLYTNLFRHMMTQLKKKRYNDSKEKEIIKLFKNSLCRLVSTVFKQDELPEGDYFDIFPQVYWEKIKSTLSDDELSRFVFSVLQSKCLCEEVPESFIQEALEKHKKTLTTPREPLTPEILQVLTDRGRKFGKLVKRYYNPQKGFLPTGKATCHFPRKSGGVKGDLVHKGILRNDKHTRFDPDDRPEPFVIMLCGQPGSGKSSRINQIVFGLSSLFPGVSPKDLVYQRTCSVDHWDGYNGQPITIMDDLGQSTLGDDIREFQTLVSTVPYVLPMASLEEKGMKFSSQIIICTTNLPFGGSIGSTKGCPIIEQNSFWRRAHFPIFTEEGLIYRLKENVIEFKKRDEFLFHNKDPQERVPVHGISAKSHLKGNKNNSEFWEPIDLMTFDFKPIVKKRWSIHENAMSWRWRQTILRGVNIHSDYLEWLHSHDLPEELEGTGLIPDQDSYVNCYLDFSSYPPEYALPVRIAPIIEPLKVRIITAGIGETFCLKPLQDAMWKALDDEPQFKLTHGTNRLETEIERIHSLSDEGDVWISGDYTAATDSIPLEASKALMMGILESIDHMPTKRWAMKELSPHLLVYPESSGLEPVLQTNGQLMGSLLSFPLLCLLNDCTAMLAGISRNKYLINGDDILMRGSRQTYNKWKEVVSSVGLELSLGKNYIHPRYGTVNSQMIIDGNVANSGKQSVLDRRTRVLGETLRDLQIHMSETETNEVNNLFVNVNRQKLQQTIRGVGVPYSHGGLGLNWDKNFMKNLKNPELYKLIYMRDFFEKIKPQKNHLSVPYYSKKGVSDKMLRLQEEQCLEPVQLQEFHEEFLKMNHLAGTKARLLNSGPLREYFFTKDLEDYVPLPFIHTYQIPIKKACQNDRIQEFIYKSFFQNLIDGISFTYQDFKEHILKGLVGISDPSEKEVIMSFTLYDIPPSMEPPVLNFNYQATPFSKDDFARKLKTSLTPKNLGIDASMFYAEDFSDELADDYQKAMEIYNSEFPIASKSELQEEQKFDLSGFIGNQFNAEFLRKMEEETLNQFE